MTKPELESEIDLLKKKNTIMWNALVALKKAASETLAKGSKTNPAFVFEVTCQAITKIEFMTTESKDQ